MIARPPLDATHDIEPLAVCGGSARVQLIRAAMSQAYRVFVDTLSVKSRFNRFHVLGDTIHDSLIKHLTHVDQSSHVAMAVFDDAHPGLMIAEARYVIDEQFHAEWAIAVADQWQRRGVGNALSSILLRHAHTHHVIGVWGILQRENQPMNGWRIDWGSFNGITPETAGYSWSSARCEALVTPRC